ncbi:MAG: hypothetical protein PUH83_07030, partial [Bacteroidales bacterium]|nr:hypothetical protein [Bacteroidales bacterium]MDY5447053.1 hypothetical protein [Sodaliphilus sp.]
CESTKPHVHFSFSKNNKKILRIIDDEQIYWCETNIQKGADNEKLAQWNIPMDRFCIKSHKTVTP